MLNFWSFTSPLGAHRRPQFQRSTINNHSDYAIAIKQHVAVSISPTGVRLIINLLHANKCKRFWTLQRVASDVNWTRANPTPAHDCHVRLREWNHSRHFERGSYWNVKYEDSDKSRHLRNLLHGNFLLIKNYVKTTSEALIAERRLPGNWCVLYSSICRGILSLLSSSPVSRRKKSANTAQTKLISEEKLFEEITHKKIFKLQTIFKHSSDRIKTQLNATWIFMSMRKTLDWRARFMHCKSRNVIFFSLR